MSVTEAIATPYTPAAMRYPRPPRPPRTLWRAFLGGLLGGALHGEVAPMVRGWMAEQPPCSTCKSEGVLPPAEYFPACFPGRGSTSFTPGGPAPDYVTVAAEYVPSHWWMLMDRNGKRLLAIDEDGDVHVHGNLFFHRDMPEVMP